MQALQYAKAVKTIVTDMKVSELISLLYPLLTRGTPNIPITEETKDKFAALLFSSRAGYEHLLEHAQTAKVLKSLKVGEIYDTARLGRLVSLLSTVPTSPQLVGSAAHVFDFYSFYSL